MRELTLFRRAVLADCDVAGYDSRRSRLIAAFRGLEPKTQTSALGAVALDLHAAAGTQGRWWAVGWEKPDTFASVRERAAEQALTVWETTGNVDRLVEAAADLIQARAAER